MWSNADSAVMQHDGKAGNEYKPAVEDTMSRKTVHDAAPYIRSLAQLQGRNANWAERAEREAVSLSATEALNLKVIDYVAADVPELLKQVNNREVSVLAGEQIPDTASTPFRIVELDWRTRLPAVITNPSVAYMPMFIGIRRSFFELSSPGFVLPGVAFMIAEAFFPTFSELGIGEIISARRDFAGLHEPGGIGGPDSTDGATLERREIEEATADYANKQT
jgi:membrane-bound serine protease (ClpP class)